MWKCLGRKLAGRCSILSVVAVFMLSACSSVAPIFKDNESLGSDEGGVLLMVHSKIKEGQFNLKAAGLGGTTFTMAPYPAGVQFRMLKLPAGDYEIASITLKNGLFDNRLFTTSGVTFTVKAGVMNYPGDLFLAHAPLGPGFMADLPHPLKISLQFVDKQDRIEALLAERYPSLLRRYPLEVRPVSK